MQGKVIVAGPGKVLDSVASLLITSVAMVAGKPKKEKSTPMFPEGMDNY